MRIVLVLEDLNDSGANRVSLDRAEHWRRHGETVTVFITADPTAGSVPVPAGLTVVHGGGRRRLRTALPIALVRLVGLTRRADVVVAGTEVGFGLLLAWVAARLVRRPFAVTVQSRVDRAVAIYVGSRLRSVTRAALVRADLAVCVARALVDSTVGYGVPAVRVVAVPNAVPRPELLLRAAESANPATTGDHSVVVGVGRLTHQKGFDLLVRAHAQALAAGAPAHRVVVLGDGEDERENLLRLIAELGVQDTVWLVGFAPNPHAVVSRASLFVLSSRWEGFSLCLAEALAVGTACVAFDCVAGPAEVLDSGRFGRLVPADDVDSLAAAIRDHLLDPARLTGMAELAAQADLAIFDPARAADLHLRALRSLVEAAAT